MKILYAVITAFILVTFSQAQILTDFENDTLNGWRSEGDGIYYLELSTGNPGNCMRVDDDATGDLNIAIAPVTFLGDWSAADTTDSLLVDVYVSLISGSLTPDLWAFRISGPGGSATSPVVTPTVGLWTHIAIPLDSTLWTITSGNWREISSYISHLEVRAEYINGDEFVRLDNIGLTFSPVTVPINPPVISNFEQGTYEGWTFKNSGGTSIPSSGGNPGRYIRISDGTGLTEAFAPPKFLGDWTALDDQAAIQFDLNITGFSGPFLQSDFWIELSSPNGRAYLPMDSSVTHAFNHWETFSFLISEDVWTVTSGTWSTLIADVRQLRMIVEYINGSEIVCLDNFQITDSPPVAAFSADPLYVFLGEEVHFTDLSLNAPDSWLWEFGDGNTSNEPDPVHVYQKPGLYDVRLTVPNFFGSDMLGVENYIEVPGISDSILFADDFDDNDIHPAWRFRNGTWVEHNQNMSQTSNDGSGFMNACYALVGSHLWKNYQFDVDLRSSDNDRVGVVFNYIDENNFYLFTWQLEGLYRAILCFVDGVQTELVADTVGYVTNQEYHLSISTYNSHITVGIDSLEIFSLSDPTFTAGKAGLYCVYNQSSFWDNFKITNLDFTSSIAYEFKPANPENYTLAQNYPNPFNPLTTIRYNLPAAGNVELTVFNIVGQKIATLVSGRQTAGTHAVKWEATHLSSGVYFYVLQVGEFRQVRKMMVVK
jgi:PKD repeat protein